MLKKSIINTCKKLISNKKKKQDNSASEQSSKKVEPLLSRRENLANVQSLNHKYASMAEEVLKYFKNLDGKTILEIGCDQKGELIHYFSSKYNPKNIIGLNMTVKNEKITENCEFNNGDIRNTNYPDDTFDYIYSLAAFEHIFNLDDALNEMHRILKPHGLLYTKFGPIWSSTSGHHLWVQDKGETYNYQNFKLPAYCHLLMTPEQLMSYCNETSPPDVSEKIVRYIYSSKEQNRLFYEDYFNIVKGSPFECLFFYGTPDFPHKENKLDNDYTTYLKNLANKYPGYGFNYSTIWMLLGKN